MSTSRAGQQGVARAGRQGAGQQAAAWQWPRATGAPRVVAVEGGPLLIEGPVEIVLPDGATRMCERPVIALCTCRRSLRMPFCDTSHRRRNRGAARFPSRAATTAQAGAEGAKQAEEA